MDKILKRTWAQVNLNAIDNNFKAVKSCLKPETLVCCVVKADAYGHGAVKLAEEYVSLGADWFAVSNLDEAVQLRDAGIKLPILILGYTPPCMAPELSSHNITQAVIGLEYGLKLSEEAVKAGVSVKAHIKLDTGMSRVGFFYQNPERDGESISEIEKICLLPGIDADGIFTHFAVADEGESGRTFTEKQFKNFTDAISKLKSRGVNFKIRHCANSAAIFDYPEMQLDMVRPGVILYGLQPSCEISHQRELTPAMELKSAVSLVKTIPEGTAVSYGSKFVSGKATKVATVPVGYADGYPRRLYEKAFMLVRGKRAKIIGRVCMDQLMLDVSDIPGVKTGDTVTAFGSDGNESISADELANYTDTINYEIICGVSKRVPRIYLKDGKESGRLNYILK